jgi:predicted CXXCH cytochrome family protein
MSCGGCHLDGFVSTNLVFFEALVPGARAADAQIGHVGLKDLFSTAPTPDAPAFDPHDVLVAFSDQGGLAPDRSGAHRAGAIEPSQPTPEARQMAARVARVIARDLPLGPSWLLPGPDKPNTDYDGAWCGNCHKAEYEAWQKSVHARSAQDPMVAFGAGVEVKARGPQYTRLCAGCHDPVTARTGDTTLRSGRGITCLGCHDTERMIRAGGNADSEVRPHDWTEDHRDWAMASLAILRKPEFCGGCHQQFVPSGGIEAIATLHEWQDSPYNGKGDVTACVDCHAPKSDGESAGVKMPVADHAMIGGNVYLASQRNDPALVDRVTKFLRTAIQLQVKRDLGTIVVNVSNKGAGHAFPTGVADIREPWVELQALDAAKHVLARFGGPDAAGLVPTGAARFGFDIAAKDGRILLLHELSETTKFPFDRRVPALGDVDLLFLPPSVPPDTAELDAVLYYRNVRTPYYRAASGDPAGTAPDVEVARAVLP